MLRNIWIAVCGTLLSGGLVMAQPPGPAPAPFGNPGAYGYPGYPTPPYGPPLPMERPAPQPNGGPPMQPWGYPPMGPGGMMPYGNPGPMGPGGMMPAMPYGNPGPMGPGGMMPGMPYGYPQSMPAPPDPRRPVGMPNYDGVGPKQGAAEPYMVGPGSNPVVAQPPAPRTLPPAPLTPALPESYIEPASYGPPTPPAEPYAMYEGPRYLADVKQDNVTVFGQINYIHWWTRHDQTPPLLTTGNSTSVNPGSLANADTTILLGGNGRPIAPDEFSGVQAAFGVWLDPERLNSLELGAFYLAKNSRTYNFASDANGNNVIAQPVQTGPPYTENALPIALPGLLAGGATVTSTMNLFGAEVNFGRNLFRLNGWSVDALGGFRYMYLNDTLNSGQNFTSLPAAAGLVSFLGAPQPAGTIFLLNDTFNLTNRFYGGQIGARVDWVSCYKLDLGGVVKVAFGSTIHSAYIDGTTTVNGVTAPGGAYNQVSDIGHFNSNDFTVITELNLTVGYQIHPNVRLTAGYNLLYWPRVERAGDQIDRVQDAGQSPSDPLYTPGTIGIHPQYLNQRTDFWAQGVNVGVEVKY